MASKRDLRSNAIDTHMHKPDAAQRITLALITRVCKGFPGARLEHPIYPGSGEAVPIPHIAGLDAQPPPHAWPAAALGGTGLEEHLLPW